MKERDEELTKGKAATIGEVRTHGGKKMKKTAQGWVSASDSQGKKESSTGMHYKDMNVGQLHEAAAKLGVGGHDKMGAKDLRAAVADKIIAKNIKEGIDKMKNRKKGY